ncbi:PAS domain-containing sensor histidine kinase [Mucilaginibacter sp. McL0603]|uniref:PAS domain-containing sensor histidine kinase n=1 Tax=Mucilaginibacter sp. McL0603 TaxID=3415670 RepID=UPI003CEA31A8
MEPSKSYEQLLSENQELQWRLEEANDTIEAIRTGQVDALVVKNENSHQLYTLKSSDHTYRVFIEKMSEGAVTINREGFILYCNSSFANLVKCSLEKVIGVPFETFVADGSKKKYYKLNKAGWGTDNKEELFIKDRFDKLTCCLCSFAALEMDGGAALSVIITDLTIQKDSQMLLKLQNEKLEAAQNLTVRQNDELETTVKERTKDLLVSRENFKLLANHITQMSWTNLPNGDINFYNQRWFEYTGLSYKETNGWPWRVVLHPDDVEETIARYIESLRTGKIFEIENRYRRGRDGTYRWHLNRAVPLKNEKGEITFWVGTATDIEDQKRELERKDEFIGVASHELKTPLTSLKGYLQLISMHKTDELPVMIKQYIGKANIAIKKLQFLVDDLLDVSKIKAGRLNYNIDTVNLRTITDACVENSVHMNPSYTFEVDNCTDYMVKGNSERLEQVLMNLINNAIKYSQGSKRVIVKTRKYENWVRVSVTDFGIGLSEEQQFKIFERFYRVEDKKNMTSGLGMGLYISSEIVNTHNGKLGVESKLGEGSTFYFDLPLEG